MCCTVLQWLVSPWYWSHASILSTYFNLVIWNVLLNDWMKRTGPGAKLAPRVIKVQSGLTVCGCLIGLSDCLRCIDRGSGGLKMP